MDQNYHVNNDITVISIFYVLRSLQEEVMPFIRLNDSGKKKK